MNLMKNNITILGAYGTKGFDHGTTSYSINQHHVLDAGNLLHGLKEKAVAIEAIWISHSHLDHIVDIAYILDNYFDQRTSSLKLMGQAETLLAIQKHFLNDVIWPDFSKIKLLLSDEMAVTYVPIKCDEVHRVDEATEISLFKSDHTVPCCGFIVHKPQSALLITNDTYSLQEAVKQVNRNDKVSALVVECSFPSNMKALAIESKHLTPELLFDGLKSLEKNGLKLYINHIKPLCEKEIIDEIAQYKGAWNVQILKDGDKIIF